MEKVAVVSYECVDLPNETIAVFKHWDNAIAHVDTLIEITPEEQEEGYTVGVVSDEGADKYVISIFNPNMVEIDTWTVQVASLLDTPTMKPTWFGRFLLKLTS